MRNSRGFTLIEMLVVIGLLGLLFVALLPLAGGAEEQNRRAVCKALVEQAAQAAKAYANQRRFGDFPRDDFYDITGKLKDQPSNGYNTGIESFLFLVNRSDSGKPRFPERDDYLGNSDDDKGRIPIAKLDRVERVELVDPWDNPIAYFHNKNYGIEQTYRMVGENIDESDAEQSVRAWRDGAVAINKGTFQIFSAGPDGVFNTEDDIGNFTVPE